MVSKTTYTGSNPVPPEIFFRVYSLMVEHTAHNGKSVSSTLTKLMSKKLKPVN